jgi:hypothetical protein
MVHMVAIQKNKGGNSLLVAGDNRFYGNMVVTVFPFFW